jgi:hypothetical protein
MKLSNKIVPFIGCLFLIAVFIECAWIGFSIDNAVRVLMETMVGTIWVAFGIVVPTDKARLELKAIKEELKVTESLLNERQRLLDAIPECPEHGKCVPFALEWIEMAKSEWIERTKSEWIERAKSEATK